MPKCRRGTHHCGIMTVCCAVVNLYQTQHTDINTRTALTSVFQCYFVTKLGEMIARTTLGYQAYDKTTNYHCLS